MFSNRKCHLAGCYVVLLIYILINTFMRKIQSHFLVSERNKNRSWCPAGLAFRSLIRGMNFYVAICIQVFYDWKHLQGPNYHNRSHSYQ